MKKQIILISLILIVFQINAQNKPAYQIFSAKGKKVAYAKMIPSLAQANIILFGELHNDPIAHWMQFEISNDLLKTNKLIFGAEMFETDNQSYLNEYLANKINESQFDSLARLWKNYKTDYKPLVELSKENNAPFIATNIPRHYANLVYKNGFKALDSLPLNEKTFIAPLPINYNADLNCYKNILEMAQGHGGPHLPKAQAIKDATMAHFILMNFNPEKIFIHFNGAYHSDNFESILWHLKQAQPNLNYKTISTVLQNDLSKLENDNIGKADFIIVVDKDMTKTY